MPPSDLYERDYFAWILEQVRVLREHRVEEVDWVNLAEEIEDLGKSEKRSVESHLARIVEHLLKLVYSPSLAKDLNRRGWQISVREARRQLHRLLDESPSLRRKMSELFPHAYHSGRNAVLIGTDLAESALPENSPWTLEQTIDNGFLPDNQNAVKTAD